jgi:hypothetical protein
VGVTPPWVRIPHLPPLSFYIQHKSEMIKLDMLIKKSKSLKNWFKVKFKKHPYLYSFLLGWIIFIVPGLYGFYRSWSNTTGDLVVSILILLNFVILLLWFQKNKSKIKPFYKRNKKIFNRVNDFFENPELVKTLNYFGEPK